MGSVHCLDEVHVCCRFIRESVDSLCRDGADIPRARNFVCVVGSSSGILPYYKLVTSTKLSNAVSRCRIVETS